MHGKHAVCMVKMPTKRILWFTKRRTNDIIGFTGIKVSFVHICVTDYANVRKFDFSGVKELCRK